MNDSFFKNLIIGISVSLIFLFSGHTVFASLFDGDFGGGGDYFDGPTLPPEDVEAIEEIQLAEEITNLGNSITSFEDHVGNIYDLSDRIDYSINNFEDFSINRMLQVDNFIDDNSSLVASLNIAEMETEYIKLTGRYNSLINNIAEVGRENLTEVQRNQIDEIKASMESIESKINSALKIKEKFNQLVDLRTPDEEEDAPVGDMEGGETEEESGNPSSEENGSDDIQNTELTEKSIDDAISIVNDIHSTNDTYTQVIDYLKDIKSHFDSLSKEEREEVKNIISKINSWDDERDNGVEEDDILASDVESLVERLKKIAKKVCADDLVLAEETESTDTSQRQAQESNSGAETGYAPSRSYTVSSVEPQTGEKNKEEGKKVTDNPSTETNIVSVSPKASSFETPSAGLETNENNQTNFLSEEFTGINISSEGGQQNDTDMVNSEFNGNQDFSGATTVGEGQVVEQDYTQTGKTDYMESESDVSESTEENITITSLSEGKTEGGISLLASDLLQGSRDGGILSEDVKQLLGMEQTKSNVDDEMVGRLVRVLIEEKGFPPVIAGALAGALVGVSTETEESLASSSVNTISKMVTALRQIDNANLSLNGSDLEQLASLVYNISENSGINVSYLARLVTSLAPGEVADVFSLTSDSLKDSPGNISAVLKSIAKNLGDYEEEYVRIKLEDLLAMIHTLQNDVDRRNSVVGSNQPTYTPSPI